MIRALLDPSPDMLLAKRLVDRHGTEQARRIVVAACGKLTTVELAALAADWTAWARPKQLPPASFRSWGDLTSRGWGKTETKLRVLSREIQAGRSKTLIMSAQNLTKTEAIQVEGLMRVAPPWFRPIYHASDFMLEWPNGARGFAYTPEVPDAIRSENADLAWLSELGHWPKATREEAYSNFVFATRVNGSRTLWDATPKRGHPILKRLLERAEKHPTKHFVVRGTIYENPHIDRAALQDMLDEYGGTQKGREELLGEMLGDEDAIFRSAWFSLATRSMPARLRRRILIVDPAITSDARSSDSSGILEMGIDDAGHLSALANLSGKHRGEDWAAMVLDRYVVPGCGLPGCDLIVVETNRGGDSHVGLLRVIARSRGLDIVEIGKDDPVPPRREGKVCVRAITARRQKAARAEGAAALCERGRVSFVAGVLGDLEEQLAGFDGTENKSDDAVDAFVHGCHELAGLGADVRDYRSAFTGIAEVAAALAAPSTGAAANLAAIFGGGSPGRI